MPVCYLSQPVMELMSLGKFDYFGERALFNDAPRAATSGRTARSAVAATAAWRDGAGTHRP